MNKEKILYIISENNDFLDDSIFSGLRNFCDYYDIYYLIPNNISAIERYNRTKYRYKEDLLKSFNTINIFDKSLMYDYCIVGQIWESNLLLYKEIKDKILKKTIFIDGMDIPKYNIGIKADYVFRRETLEDESFLPFCCPNDLLNMHTDSIDFFINFQMGPSSEKRIDLYRYVKNNIPLNNSLVYDLIGNSNYFSKMNEWWENISKTKIIFSDVGGGKDCYRFWEGIATGNYVISRKIDLYNKIKFPENVIFFDNYNEIKNIVNKIILVEDCDIIKNRNNIKKILKNSQSTYNRAEKIINKIKEWR